jgi:hypothetical protein
MTAFLSSFMESTGTIVLLAPVNHPNPQKMRWMESVPLLVINVPDKTTLLRLKDTQISCFIKDKYNTPAVTFNSRFEFLQKITTEVTHGCQKKEEAIAVIFLGSLFLLTEFLISKSLIEEGYSNLHIFLVDPAYRYNKGPDGVGMTKARNEFRKQIENAYFTKYKRAFPKDHLHFLSRAQVVEKYFPANHPHVLVIESLPDHAFQQYCQEKDNIPSAKPHEMFCHSQIVPQEDANAVAFMPTDVKETFSGFSFDNSIPSTLYSIPHSFECGCKIDSHGSVSIHFFGFADYLKLRSKYPVEIISQLISNIQTTITQKMQTEIQNLRKDSPQRLLTQDEKSRLLALFQKLLNEIKPQELSLEFFFMADYDTDRSDLLSYLSSNAGHHFRKNMVLASDSSTGTGYKISTTTI